MLDNILLSKTYFNVINNFDNILILGDSRHIILNSHSLRFLQTRLLVFYKYCLRYFTQIQHVL